MKHLNQNFNFTLVTNLFYHIQYLISHSIFLSPANCSDATLPTNGFIEVYHNTTEGAEIHFRCNPEFVPAGRMRAVCALNGRWNPDPACLRCTCEYPWEYKFYCIIMTLLHQLTIDNQFIISIRKGCLHKYILSKQTIIGYSKG